jgi:hypothetical protein
MEELIENMDGDGCCLSNACCGCKALTVEMKAGDESTCSVSWIH